MSTTMYLKTGLMMFVSHYCGSDSSYNSIIHLKKTSYNVKGSYFFMLVYININCIVYCKNIFV